MLILTSNLYTHLYIYIYCKFIYIHIKPVESKVWINAKVYIYIYKI